VAYAADPADAEANSVEERKWQLQHLLDLTDTE